MVVVLAAPVFAAPQPPDQFYGNVTIGSAQAPAGTVVSAKIGGVTYASTTVDVNGQYGHNTLSLFYVPAKDPSNTASVGGVPGDTIQFYVGTTVAQTAIFSSGGINLLNLNIAGPDDTLSNLAVNGRTVSGFTAGTLTYNVVLAYGTTTVPTVTATPNDAANGATAVVTQASSVIGSAAVLVTAKDGTTHQTYTINFSVASPPSVNPEVDLGTAANYAILAESGITGGAGSSITGNIGVSPLTATAITGFGLTMDSSGKFATSTSVYGKVYAATYADPTPANLSTAVGDMLTAYTTANGLTTPVPVVNEGAGNLGGKTLAPGIYKFDTSVTIPSPGVTLDAGGDSNAFWVFQITGDLSIDANQSVTLIGGALPQNIFWVVLGNIAPDGVQLYANSVFNGNILCATNIAMDNEAVLNGRALSQTNVSLIDSVVTEPVLSAAATIATSNVSIAGASTAKAGVQLTAVLAPIDTTATYQWQESSTSGGSYTAITTNGTSSTYTPVTTDVGKYIEVVATIPTTDATYIAGSATSSPTAAVLAAAPAAYALTVVASPSADGTATDMTAASPYVVGTVVNINAVPAAGYQFVNWTTISTGTFAAATSATTTFTMPPAAATVAANFEAITTTPGTQNVTSVVNSTGTFTSSVKATSADNNASVIISAGTIGLTAAGAPLTQITVTQNVSPPAPSATASAVALTYDFGPSGATFNTPITITLPYNPASVPAGATPYVAWYNTITGQWQQLTTVSINTSATPPTISVLVSHFTSFSVFTGTLYDKVLNLNTNSWSLISTNNYINDSTSPAFNTEGVTLAYKYGATGYLSATVADLTPVSSIYVQTNSAGGFVDLNYSTTSVPVASTVNLVPGWNLISSATLTPANDVLSQLRYINGNNLTTNLTTLVGQGSYNLDGSSCYIDATTWANLTSFTMNPFDGYWVYVNAATTFGVIP